MPPGLDLVRVVEAAGGALAERLTGSRWRLSWAGFDAAAARAAVAALLAAESVPVQRLTKNGVREFDARAAVVGLEVAEDGLELLSRHQVPLVRPDDVLQALTRTSPGFAVPPAVLITRLAQGELGPGGLADPLS